MRSCVLLALGDREEQGSSGEFGGAEGAGSAPPLSWEPLSRHFTPGQRRSRVKNGSPRIAPSSTAAKLRSGNKLGQDGKRSQQKSVCPWPRQLMRCGVQGSPRCMSPSHRLPWRKVLPGVTGCLPCSRALLPSQGAAGQQEARMEGKEQCRGGGTKAAVVNTSQSPCPGTTLGWQGHGESRGTEGEII